MSFGDKIKKEAFISSKGKCANCHIFPIQNYHHINPKTESMDDSYDNCLPVCGNCHNFVMRGELSTKDQKIVRDAWYAFNKWRITDDEKAELRKQYDQGIGIKDLTDNIEKLNKSVEEFNQSIKDHVEPKILHEKADNLINQINRSQFSYTTLFSATPKGDITKFKLEMEDGESVSGIICPHCNKSLTVHMNKSGIITCPFCNGIIGGK